MVSIVRLTGKLQHRWLKATHHLESLVVRRQLSSQRSAHHEQIIADLQTEGVHVTTIDRLLPQSAPGLYPAFKLASVLLAEDPSREGSSVWSRGASSNDLRASVLLARLPQLYLLGLDANILALVQQYFCLPIAYHGAVIRHSLVDGLGAGPRLWHQDAEDFHVLRMVVYLNDVTPGGGPFEYIPRNSGVSYKSFAGMQGALTNDRMNEVVPMDHWKRVYGPTGTVVLADTAKVFHHESLQTERNRAVIMIGYSSRRPKGVDLAMAHFPAEQLRSTLLQVVPPALHAHVFDWRRPIL